MSILKNRRNLSRYEYERSFDIAYKHIVKCMNATPNRLKRWINVPINKKLNETYMNIMELRTNYFPKETIKRSTYEILNSSIDGILGLQLHFYSYWNVMGYNDKKKAHWCDLFNHDLVLLRGLLYKNPLYNSCNDEMEYKIVYYKNEDIKNAKFLSNMSKLHNYTHRKIAHAKLIYADRECAMISDLIDYAWFYSLEANRKIPKTKKEYEHRKNCVSNAISCLKKIEVPLVSLFNLMEYSENILHEWSSLFSSTLKNLYGIKKSDNERFSKLK